MIWKLGEIDDAAEISKNSKKPLSGQVDIKCCINMQGLAFGRSTNT